MSRFTIDGQDNVKFGASTAAPKVRIVLGELASISLYLIRVIDMFLNESKYGDSSFHQRRLVLETIYENLSVDAHINL